MRPQTKVVLKLVWVVITGVSQIVWIGAITVGFALLVASSNRGERRLAALEDSRCADEITIPRPSPDLVKRMRALDQRRRVER